MKAEREQRFEQFVRDQGPGLSRVAWLLAPEPSTAADLLQTALEKTYAAWSRVERAEDPAAYARRILANAATDEARAGRRRPPVAHRDVVEVDRAGDRSREVDDRAELRGLLAVLPARQRTVVVLRYYLDLSEADTAALLGISPGAVKSHAARGLARLRQMKEPHV